jgi:hypothetical protein
VFTARYALSPYIKQIRFVFKGSNMVLCGRLVEETFWKQSREGIGNPTLKRIIVTTYSDTNRLKMVAYKCLCCLGSRGSKTGPRRKVITQTRMAGPTVEETDGVCDDCLQCIVREMSPTVLHCDDRL